MMNVQFEKPVHPTKTTYEEDCEVYEVQDFTASEELLVHFPFIPSKGIENEVESRAEIAEVTENISAAISQALPPKYILFKRLKVAIV